MVCICSRISAAVIDGQPGTQIGGWRRLPRACHGSSEAVLQTFASMSPEEAINHLQTSREGLVEEEAESRLEVKGPNILSVKKPPTWWQLLLSVIPNPFNLLLMLLAVISLATPPPNWSTFAILVVMIVISCGVRFWQEYKSSVAAIKLQEGVSTDVRVRRQLGDPKSANVLETVVAEKRLVPGDILLINPGDNVPADCLVLDACNLRISQSRYARKSFALLEQSYLYLLVSTEKVNLSRKVGSPNPR